MVGEKRGSVEKCVFVVKAREPDAETENRSAKQGNAVAQFFRLRHCTGTIAHLSINGLQP